MKRFIIIFFVALIIIAIGGTTYQKYYRTSRCAYDGSIVPPIYEVKIYLKDGTEKKFCSIYCAVSWFNPNIEKVEKVIVRDEIRGTEISSEVAYFVESELVTNEANDNRIHVFQQRPDAMEHMKRFNGDYVENPFYKE
ncbi:MAG TPA: hypothetical protein ACFYD6_14005 [Candidatus Brocadiia bacterium]|nr:hypothetical protein [Planctomycetota bacterium]MDO8093945.1 hypothetical protein [Candidatus Brocadiales bacterium]